MKCLPLKVDVQRTANVREFGPFTLERLIAEARDVQRTRRSYGYECDVVDVTVSRMLFNHLKIQVLSLAPMQYARSECVIGPVMKINLSGISLGVVQINHYPDDTCCMIHMPTWGIYPGIPEIHRVFIQCSIPYEYVVDYQI